MLENAFYEFTICRKVREKMAFIIKKKRYKFQVRRVKKIRDCRNTLQVDLTLNELTEVSFGKAILFAKV